MRFIETTDPWRTPGGEDGPPPHPPARAHSLLTLAQWHAVREAWPRDLPVGLKLDNTADVDDVAADLPRLALVALAFPKWTDGRAYTQARLLRARHRFAGEIRATGDVVVDMLPLLARCGFDAVRLRPDQSAQRAARALGFFDGHYQGDVLEPRPAHARDLDAERREARTREREAFLGDGI